MVQDNIEGQANAASAISRRNFVKLAAVTASQENTAQNGWYPAFWENHDQPRSVSNFFPAGTDREAAAKALATVLLTMRGTPQA